MTKHFKDPRAATPRPHAPLWARNGAFPRRWDRGAAVIAMSVRFLKLDWRRLSLFPRVGRIPGERALPHTKPAFECIRVVARSAQRWHFFQLLGVSAPKHDVVGFECCHQTFDNFFDVLSPGLLAELLESAEPDIVLVRSFFIGKMRELHGLHDAVHD